MYEVKRIGDTIEFNGMTIADVGSQIGEFTIDEWELSIREMGMTDKDTIDEILHHLNNSSNVEYFRRM